MAELKTYYFDFNNSAAALSLKPDIYKTLGSIVGAKTTTSKNNILTGEAAKRAVIKLGLRGSKRDTKRRKARGYVYCAAGKVDNALKSIVGKNVTGLGKVEYVYRVLNRSYN